MNKDILEYLQDLGINEDDSLDIMEVLDNKWDEVEYEELDETDFE